MGVPERTGRRNAWVEVSLPHARSEQPPACRRCAARSWWNGWRVVFVVVAVAVDVVERREMALARAKCSSCRSSCTCYPPGVYPRRQYQLDAVADTVARVVLGGESAARAAAPAGASATSARRWTAWVAALAEPAALCAATARVDPDAPAGAGLSAVPAARPAGAPAARLLYALEQLGLALVRAGVAGAVAVRTGLARVLHWQHAAHGDVVQLAAAPSRLSPAMALGAAEVRR